jgi:hypothetical protein
VPPEGIARDSNARRRSRLVWAPPHKNFLLKILAPAFDSLEEANSKNTGTNPAFLLFVHYLRISWNQFIAELSEWQKLKDEVAALAVAT